MRRSTLLITLLLALLTAVGPISTDMYLPAFPAMRTALSAGPGEVQLTLAAWFLGLSVGQMMHGPLADSYGRRPPLLFGTLLYTLASIGCALSDTMPHLSWWRFWAAFGAAASLVIPRAVIADVVRNGAEAARMLSRMVMVMGVVPILAPSLGALVSEHWSWRGIFWLAALYGLVCCGLIFWLLEETLPQHRRGPLRAGHVVVGYVRVWQDVSYRAHALQGGFGTFSLFAFLGGAPQVFVAHYGLSPTRFGALFVLNAVGYIAGTQANARAVGRFGIDRTLTGGSVGLVACTTAMLVMGVTGIAGAAGLAIGMMGCMAALGFVLPGAALGSVLGHGREAGAASALYGTTVFFVGAVSTALVGWFGGPAPVTMTALMLMGAMAVLVCDHARPRRGLS